MLGERIQITELWEFQLYELGKIGDPRPIGDPKCQLAPEVFFEWDGYDVDPEKMYAIKRRRLTLGRDGTRSYGGWEWITQWKPPYDRGADD